MTITTLIENTSPHPHLCAEHGLSLYIQTDNHKNYLLDTGASGNFVDNAIQLGIDLTTLDAVIISHNHSDHIGGLDRLLTLNHSVLVFIKRKAQNGFYVVQGNNIKNISADPLLFEKYKNRIVWIDNEYQLDATTYLLSSHNHKPQFVCQDERLHMGREDHLVHDNFQHELFIVFIEHNQLIILSSCSHNGIVNIVNTALAYFPNKIISHIIGGFHMKGAAGLDSLSCSPKFVTDVAKELKQHRAQVYTGHCTGHKAYELLLAILGDDLHYLDTGSSIRI